MSDLSRRKCVPCERGVPKLSEEEIAKLQNQLSRAWEIIDGQKIRREFKFNDFKEALKFINRVGGIAEAEGHHPDIHNFYNRVILELWTHAIGGLHENDFIVAEKINRLEAE